ncbi:MAG: bifunctional 2-polyprenyl-6-hydroxyphenol methylase/3-demethylubiquinol 3-O-methyltransferase UbiG [Alphaproteobacteria bacterium]
MSTILKSEVEKFSKDAPLWWDEKGPFAPLHRLNPARMGYIRAQIGAHYGLGETGLKPFKGLSMLDVGCGGGLVCEPLARLGAEVTGIDADPVAIETAKTHAAQSGLEIDYQNRAAENIKEKYDVVLALEIIEHVEDPAAFVKTISKLVKPGGLVIFSTLNRTPKSFALGIVAAEYVMRIVPRGTHSWRRFVKPSELARHMRAAGMEPKNISGLVLSPLSGEFKISENDTGVNYFMTARA